MATKTDGPSVHSLHTRVSLLEQGTQRDYKDFQSFHRETRQGFASAREEAEKQYNSIRAETQEGFKGVHKAIGNLGERVTDLGEKMDAGFHDVHGKIETIKKEQQSNKWKIGLIWAGAGTVVAGIITVLIKWGIPTLFS